MRAADRRSRTPSRSAARRAAFPLLAATLLMASACATIRHPRPQTVWVHSRPPGADVFVDERHVGVTPVAIAPNGRARNTVLRLEKDGFAPAALPLRRSLSRWLLGDFALPVAASVGAAQEATGWEVTLIFARTLSFTLGIDLMTGAAFRFPGGVRAKLERLPTGELTALANRAPFDGRDVGAAQNLRKGDRLVPVWMMEKAARFTVRGKP